MRVEGTRRIYVFTALFDSLVSYWPSSQVVAPLSASAKLKGSLLGLLVGHVKTRGGGACKNMCLLQSAAPVPHAHPDL